MIVMSTLRSTRACLRAARQLLCAGLGASGLALPGCARAAHSITATTSPGPTAAPAVTLISFTVPAFSAVTAFSIFMASSTQTVWPTSTVVTDRDHDLHDRSLHRHHDGARPRSCERRPPPSEPWCWPALGHGASGSLTFTS